jgi:hypothetical protein
MRVDLTTAVAASETLVDGDPLIGFDPLSPIGERLETFRASSQNVVPPGAYPTTMWPLLRSVSEPEPVLSHGTPRIPSGLSCFRK